jgi:hypothetical protein
MLGMTVLCGTYFTACTGRVRTGRAGIAGPTAMLPLCAQVIPAALDVRCQAYVPWLA